MFISRTSMLISTKLGIKPLLVNWTHVCLNEGTSSFSRGNNSEIAKMH